MKQSDAGALLVSSSDEGAVGKYTVEVTTSDTPNTWWVGTKLDSNTRVPDILANRANRLGFKSTATVGGATYTASSTKVYMKVC